MPTLQTLIDIEPVIESASAYILSASYGRTNVYTSMQPYTASMPRIEITCQRGAPTGHKFVSGSNDFYDMAYNAVLSVYVVSDRAKTNVTTHRALVNDVAVALTNNYNFNTGSLLPYHYLHRSDISNQAYALRAEEDATFDETGITIEQIVYIKPQYL